MIFCVICSKLKFDCECEHSILADDDGLNREEPMAVELPKPRATYLSAPEQFNLNQICGVLTQAFGPITYQVGSSLERANYRDVDLRCILPDEEFNGLFASPEAPELVNIAKLRLLNTAISEWLSARTELPIDFQFQHTNRANAKFEGKRNFMGYPMRMVPAGQE